MQVHKTKSIMRPLLTPNSLMAYKILFFITFLFLLALVYAQNQSPFEFIKEFQGCQKGMKVRGLNRMKSLLSDFGYMNCSLRDDEFDESLEAALKTYQLNYHLSPTGALDSQTVTTMMMPRCGNPDIINGINFMEIPKYTEKSLFANYPKWPKSKSHLTYALPPNTSTIAVRSIDRAFMKWENVTHFTFSKTINYSLADLKISFHTKKHGDNRPFDGPGGVVAHAFGPLEGILHFDGDELWLGLGQLGGLLDFETVALHGIGHLLG